LPLQPQQPQPLQAAAAQPLPLHVFLQQFFEPAQPLPLQQPQQPEPQQESNYQQDANPSPSRCPPAYLANPQPSRCHPQLLQQPQPQPLPAWAAQPR
jgi:hypothetical protein